MEENIQENIQENKNFFTANLMFMLLAILFISGSFLMQALSVSFKGTIIIIQYVIILIPIVLAMKLTGVNIKKHFRLKRISFKTAIQVILITLFSLPIAYTLNFIMNYILIKLDLFQIQSMDVGSGVFNFFIMTLLISVTPGICEEVFFRGMIFSAYEGKMQSKYAILLSGIFFGLFHFNLQNLLLPTFLGIVFGYLVYKTGSIISSMIAHTLFNFIGLIVMYFSPDSNASELEEAIKVMNETGLQAIIFLIIVSGISVGILYLLLKWFNKSLETIELDDILVIKKDHAKVISVEEDYYHVEVLGENKRINKDTLKELDYKVIKQVNKVENNKVSLINFLFIGTVISLYIGFMVIIYTTA